jgi:hypothetical protein
MEVGGQGTLVALQARSDALVFHEQGIYGGISQLKHIPRDMMTSRGITTVLC